MGPVPTRKLTGVFSEIIMRVRKEETEKMMRSDQDSHELEIVQTLKGFPITLLKVYPRSLSRVNGLMYGLIRTPEGKYPTGS